MSKTPHPSSERITKQAPATIGTQLAAELRSATNSLSDEKRQELRNFGMALIYGGSSGTKQLPVRR
jgi:hypothetical protein